MGRKKYTLTLDPAIVAKARKKTENLSETVTQLLKEFVASSDRDAIVEGLKNYANEAREIRKRIGLFGQETRKF